MLFRTLTKSFYAIPISKNINILANRNHDFNWNTNNLEHCLQFATAEIRIFRNVDDVIAQGRRVESCEAVNFIRNEWK